MCSSNSRSAQIHVSTATTKLTNQVAQCQYVIYLVVKEGEIREDWGVVSTKNIDHI